jgi:hypothetical protein
MIPAVEDFTQKQQLLLEASRLAASQAAAAAAEPAAPAAAAGDAEAEGGEAGGEAGRREQLLGKLLVSPEELREKLLVGGPGGAVWGAGLLHQGHQQRQASLMHKSARTGAAGW